MTTHSHPRPAFVNGPVLFFVGVAVVVSAAIAAVRIDWQGSSPQPTTESSAIAPSFFGVAPTAQELFDAEMAVTEAHWDATFGPAQPSAAGGTTPSFGSSPGVGPLTEEETLASALAEHEAWIAAYLGQ